MKRRGDMRSTLEKRSTSSPETDGSTAPEGPPVEETTIARVRREIDEAKRWKKAVESPTEQFLSEINPKFDSWAKVLAQLSAAGQKEEADLICASIIKLRNYWGPQLFPVNRYNAFVRDFYSVGPLKVEAAHFFEPLQLSQDESHILKIYRFSIYFEERVISRYYLERSELLGVVQYMFGRTDVGQDIHRQVQVYGTEEPSYWELREKVISDLRSESPPNFEGEN